MATTNIENIIAAMSTAIENVTPDLRPTSRFRRWRGTGPVELAPNNIRERAFQFRLGTSLTPRRLSSPTIQWHRNELLFVVTYNFDEPRQGDVVGYGFHQQAMSDERWLMNRLWFSNSLTGVSNVLRPSAFKADPPGRFARQYRLDIEWGETFT